jgi:hypothetical protein
MNHKYFAQEFGSDDRPFVNGNGQGMEYHSGTLFPEMRFSSYADAKAGALCANEAYRQGIMQAQRDMRSALGLDELKVRTF